MAISSIESGDMEKHTLHITSKSINGDNNKTIYFAVVDLNKSRRYPENFVCILPKLKPNTKAKSAFQSAFGDQSLPMAKSLLTKALRNEDEPEIKAEIKQRLNDLNPKTNPKRQPARYIY